MSDPGIRNARFVVESHNLDPAYLAPDLFTGERISLDVEGPISVLPNQHNQDLPTVLQQSLEPVIAIQRAIAATTNSSCAPLGPAWAVNGDTTRRALKPPYADTGRLTDLSVELIGIEELSDTVRKRVLSEIPAQPTVEHTQMAVRIAGRYVGGLGALVSCAVGIQLRARGLDLKDREIAGRAVHLSAKKIRGY